MRSVIFQCSVFTLAHSLTLILSAAGLLSIDPKIVEPLIAISILITAIENIVQNKVRQWRMAIIFIFGLIHGLGFANALKEIGIPENHFIGSLLFFNIGVEFGQLLIVAMAYFLISKWFGKKPWYKERITYPISSMIACIALYWTIERILF